MDPTPLVQHFPILVHSAHHWWTSSAFWSYFGGAGTLAGFGGWATAIVQGRKSKKAKTQVDEALTAERRRSARLMLLRLGPLLLAGEHALHTALDAVPEDRPEVRRALTESRTVASEIGATLAVRGLEDLDPDGAVRGNLGLLFPLIDAALADLADPEVAVVESCARVVGPLSNAVNRASVLTTTIQLIP